MTPRHRAPVAPAVLISLLVGLPVPATAGAPAFDVQGHRGCRGLAPENSLEAFRTAVDLGVTTLELDVQATADGVLIVHHDAAVDPARCVRDDGRPPRRALVRELRADEVEALTCRGGARIPRLDDVLALARDAARPIRVSIELKVPDPARGLSEEELAAQLVDAVAAHGLRDRATVQSFHVPALRAVRRLDPALRRAVLVRSRRNYSRRVREAAADVLSPRAAGLRREDVERFHREGIAVVPWVVNDPDVARRLIRWGVDGLITDRPDRMLAITDQLLVPSSRQH